MNALKCQQRSEAWYEARRGLPTCSRFDKILTAAKGEPSKSQETLINELIAESILPPEQGLVRPQLTSADIEHGMILEAEARCCYELEFASEPVREVGFVLAECGLYGGSPDALVGEAGGVEIKCPRADTHIGYVRANVLPVEYKCQVHGYMVVTGRDWWDFFSYYRGFPLLRLRVERDAFTAKLAAELLNFCAKYDKARKAFGLPTLAEKAKGAA
jgi:hypothetical protein